VFPEGIPERYDRWLQTPGGSLALQLQHRLLLELIEPQPGETLLDVGCGTGETLRLLSGLGVRGTGLDHSAGMLVAARRKLGRVPLVRGDAADLPFPDASFDIGVLNGTLEFVGNPAAAVAELARVSRRCVYIGVLNRWSLLSAHHHIQALRRETIAARARFFTVGELFRFLDEAGTTGWRWGGVPYVPNDLSRLTVVRRVADAASGWPNPFAAYLGCAARIEQGEPVMILTRRPVRLSATAAPAIAMSGVRQRCAAGQHSAAV